VTWREYQTGLEDRWIDLHGRVTGSRIERSPREERTSEDDGASVRWGLRRMEIKLSNRPWSPSSMRFTRGLSGLFVWVSTGTHASSVGRAHGGAHRKHVNYVLDADIRDFSIRFPTSGCSSLCSIALPTAGFSGSSRMAEGGSHGGRRMSETEKGTPQGAVVSPCWRISICITSLTCGCRRGGRSTRGETRVVAIRRRIRSSIQAQTEADRFLEDFRGRLGSLDWNCIPTRRAGSSSAVRSRLHGKTDARR